MKLKLKEEPKEWVKFTAVMALALGILGTLLYLRKAINQGTLLAWFGLLAFALVLCWLQPRWFRGFYRVGMTLSFHLGQLIGKVILTLVFLLMVTPLGLLLRLFGKDLLKLKRNTAAATYWQPAKTSHQFDRLF
jgi:Saxitoxin biosynthesis operon protein SxtJ